MNWVPEERNHPCQGGVGEAQRHGQSRPDRHSEENGEDSGGRQVEPHLDAVELAQGEEGVNEHESVARHLSLGVVLDGLAGVARSISIAILLKLIFYTTRTSFSGFTTVIVELLEIFK